MIDTPEVPKIPLLTPEQEAEEEALLHSGQLHELLAAARRVAGQGDGAALPPDPDHPVPPTPPTP